MSKRAIVLYMHVHQPWRVRRYTVFDTAERHDYFQEDNGPGNNRAVFEKVATKSYRPMIAVLKKVLDTHPEFKIAFSITGTFIEQAKQWAPDVLDDFRELVQTGRVEIVAETYYHSLAFFYSRNEFERQVKLHHDTIKKLFGVEPSIFRNTELMYNNDLAKWADEHGYKGILAEGWDKILEWRSPNHMYRPPNTKNIRLLLRNYKLSDDMAFRFANRDWAEWPLKSEKYVSWLNASADEGGLINLFMDYETFGEHQWAETGIFDFFEGFVEYWLANKGNAFYTPSEAVDAFEPKGEISAPETVTWADAERDLTAWLGNSMQQEALRHLYALEEDISRYGKKDLIDDWRRLQTSDHVYYMCTKWFTDGDVHAYFSPYESPYDAFLYFMNALRDVRYRLLEDHRHGGLHG